MTDGMSVKFDDNFSDVNLEKVLQEEMFKAALRCSNEWSDNISRGRGAEGSHEHGAYVNTGEARESISMIPEKPDADNYKVGSDKIQVAIAEFGRAPGQTPPPFDPIARWVREQGIASPQDDEFYPIVRTTQQNIGERGLKAFAPGRLAFQKSLENFEQDVKQRIDKEVRQE